jgi:hypothetical protein
MDETPEQIRVREILGELGKALLALKPTTPNAVNVFSAPQKLVKIDGFHDLLAEDLPDSLLCELKWCMDSTG